MPIQNNGTPSTHLNNLPPDILFHIFGYCLETGPGHINKPSASAAPLLLTQVCRTWREIANALPHLWTAIELHNTSKKSETRLSPETFLNCLGRWIKHSGDVPISIKFSYMLLPGQGTYEDYCKEMGFIVDLLLTCQNRWNILDIYVEDFSVVQRLLDAMTNLDNAPQLRKCVLEVRDKKKDNCPAWKATYSALTLQPKGRHSGYARLTGLELSDSPSTESIMWWIKQAPNLKALIVSPNLEQPEPYQLSPLHEWKLDNVSQLHIFGFKYSDIRPLLSQLTLPVLTDLYVNVHGAE
ncbi:hypothetical protein DFH11DRAFT_492991, partial [Phellopilus nigrolimitatus]